MTMNYTENVRKVAEEFAIMKHPVSFRLYTKYSTIATASWSADFYKHNWPIIVEGFMDYAYIAIRLQAESVRNALLTQGYKLGDIEHYLHIKCLVPSPEND